MSLRNTQQQQIVNSIGPANLGKKRKLSTFREELVDPYKTDKDAKNSSKNRKINDQDLSRKPATQPKQAGRDLRSSANYKDLAEGKLKGGYLTESPSRKQQQKSGAAPRGSSKLEDVHESPQENTRRQQQKNKKGAKQRKGSWGNSQEDDSDEEEEEGKEQKSDESSVDEVDHRGKKEERKNNDSSKGAYNAVVLASQGHAYGTRKQTQDSPAKEESKLLYKSLNKWLIKLADKYTDKKRMFDTQTHFEVGDIQDIQDLDSSTVRYNFKKLELLGKGAKQVEISYGQGLEFSKQAMQISYNNTQIWVKNISADVTRVDFQVKKFYLEFQPIIGLKEAQEHPILKRQIDYILKNDKENKISTKSKFIVFNYCKNGNSIDIERFLKYNWINSGNYIYTLKLEESITAKNNNKNILSSNYKNEYVQYTLDAANENNIQQIEIFQQESGHEYLMGKLGEPLKRSPKDSAKKSSGNHSSKSKRPSNFNQQLIKKGYQTEAEFKKDKKSQRSKSTVTKKEDEDQKMKENNTYTEYQLQRPKRNKTATKKQKEDTLSSFSSFKVSDLDSEDYKEIRRREEKLRKQKNEDKKHEMRLGRVSVQSEVMPQFSQIKTTPPLILNKPLAKPAINSQQVVQLQAKVKSKVKKEAANDDDIYDFNLHLKPNQPIPKAQQTAPVKQQQVQQEQKVSTRGGRRKSPSESEENLTLSDCSPFEPRGTIELAYGIYDEQPPEKVIIEIDKKKLRKQSESEEELRVRQSRKRAIRSQSSDYEENASQKSKDSTTKAKPKSRPPPVKRNTRKSAKPINEANSSSEASQEVQEEQNNQKDTKAAKQKTQKYENEYDRVCEMLQLNAIPDVLPCRDKERQQITDYLVNGIQNKGSSSSLYISGMPGTGKTATTLEVIRNLKKKYTFEFIHINAMSLTNPNLVYSILQENITGKRINPASSALFLDEFFKKKEKVKLLKDKLAKSRTKTKDQQKYLEQQANKLRVVLIDELDALVTKKQTLLYNLFDWPCHQNSRLLVIAIANTMDLPEKLQQKIASRIGNNRLVYEPYNRVQIGEIIQSRLGGAKIFDDQAITFVAMKVSSYSGDIRRSLQVAKRALEMTRDEYIEKYGGDNTKKEISVNYQKVNAAFSELYNTKTAQLLKSLRKFEVLVILAIYIEQLVSKSEKVLMDKVQDRCDNMLMQLDWGLRCIPTNNFREIVKRLQTFGILNLVIETSKIADNIYLQLFLYQDEIITAFEKDEIYLKFEMTIKIHSGETTNG